MRDSEMHHDLPVTASWLIICREYAVFGARRPLGTRPAHSSLMRQPM
jgi:hypothetical protein